MLWVLFSAIAILIGIAMFAKVEPDLPPELEFLKSKPKEAQVLDGAGAGATNMGAIALDGPATGWTFQTDGKTAEASKDFEQHIAGPGGQAYDRPSFSVTCYEGHFYARVNTRIAAAGTAPIQFDVKGLPSWTQGQNQDWFSTDAVKTLTTLQARGTVSARIAFEEAAAQKFTFNTNGLSAVLRQMDGCKL